jgi:hypothetical protein
MKVSSKRNAVRWLHIIVGSVLATYIYSPWEENVVFQKVTKFLLIPISAISGLWLWKGHLIRRFLPSNKNTSLLTTILLVSGHMIFAQSTEPIKPKIRGAEFSPIGAGVFSIAQAKAT